MPHTTSGPLHGSKIRAVLFDLDGTLIDSYPAIAASVNHVRQQCGLTPLSIAEVTRHVGRGAAYLLQQTVGQNNLEAHLAAYRQHHVTVLRPMTVLLPGAYETLQELHRRGYRLGICSNKPITFTRELVDHLHLTPFLDVVLGPEDVTRPKPAPDMLLLALQRLQLAPTDALYVGDMTVDIETARAAHVLVWVVATGSDPVEALQAARPDLRLTHLKEMLNLLS